jgi:mono/diheme cytochrome c family protein
MRYILLAFLVCAAVVIGMAGHRGDKTRRPPIELFPDMDRQPKLRPQAVSAFFKDGRSSQLAPVGTVARNSAYEDSPVNTGRVAGTTNFVETIPVPVTAQLLARGQERYGIYCLPCHGPVGDGKGVTSKLGMAVVGDLHDHKGRKLISAPDGQIFDTITNGKNLMGAYGSVLPIQDRWAVVAYVRALQLSRLGVLEDIPASERGSIK